ncbi:hypothetical protein BH09PSE3_BH09PSE3_00090 [soil metagenome]
MLTIPRGALSVANSDDHIGRKLLHMKFRFVCKCVNISHNIYETLRLQRDGSVITIMLASLSLSLSSCGGDGSTPPPASAVPTGSATTPTPSVTTPPPVTTSAPTSDVVDGVMATSAAVAAIAKIALPAIASNFDIDSELVPAWGTGAIPDSAAPDVVGAFRFICTASHESYDDPIVYPGQAGKSHLHEFFGNSGTNANSTYASLRTTGNSTCTSKVNRSGYWMPAMLNGKGSIVRPNFVSIYYKRLPSTSPECQREGKACVDLPRGLRFIFGYNMLDMSAAPTGEAYFNCQGPGSTPGHYATIVEAAKYCPTGAQLGAIISAPNCWDGVNLDSADHRSHVAYGSYGTWGYYRCPTTHPYVIPTFTLGAWFTTDDDLNRSGTWDGTMNSWHLSSDEMMGGKIPGSTFHSDWWGAWDDKVLAMWSENCIDKLLNCSGGDLGNGKQMKQSDGFSWTASPRLVPLPK